jgi:hypothetical protein
VRHLKRTPDMIVKNFTDWGGHDVFKPDFDTIDVRTTRQEMFDGYEYVTCDLNPGEAFIGHELEFNEMTKYFYNNFATPKKKLTDAEMVEINQLCRVIGRCEKQLDELEHPEPLWQKVYQFVGMHKPIVVASMAAFLVMLFFARRLQSRKS